MPLVEDHRVVLGQHAASRSDVREVERVVRDHEVGLSRALAGSLGEARGDERAAAPAAAVAADGELGPQRLRRLDLELGAVARLGLVEPALHRLPRAPVAALGEQEGLEPVQLPAAEVVLAPLEDGDGDLAPEGRRGDRHVLLEQLLLERLRRGRDDDAEPRLERGHEVGEALADARPGLGDEVLAGQERPLDRGRERRLLWPRLVLGQGARERAAGAEQILHRCAQAYGSERTFPPARRALRTKNPLGANFGNPARLTPRRGRG